MKEEPGSWSSVICSRLGGKPNRPSTSSREEEEEAGAGEVVLAVIGEKKILRII